MDLLQVKKGIINCDQNRFLGVIFLSEFFCAQLVPTLIKNNLRFIIKPSGP